MDPAERRIDSGEPEATETSQSGAFPAALRHVRRIIVLVIGGTVLAIGVAMLLLPGPAIIVIPAGLAILATEFVWAARLLDRVKRGFGFLKQGPASTPEGADPPSGAARGGSGS